jgi:Fur family ferric uptake transcriptional regulator
MLTLAPTIARARATVYRTLGLLHERGVIDATASSRSRRSAPSHHLVCEKCHRVVELQECDLGGWVDEVAGRHGFHAHEHQVEIAGLCAECRSVSAA